MEFKEQTLKKEYIYKGKILNVRKDDALLPNGKTAIREVIEHSGGSAILCEKDGKVLLVKQFRYPYAQELWEIPAGKLNAGEDPKETAIRELEEECGVKAGKMTLLYEVYPTPAYDTEIIRIFRAEQLENSNVKLDEDEFLTSAWIDKDDLKKMIRSGEIKDAKTLIALLSIL
jgi:ADP-ribose pyrophosphatase